MKIIRLIPFFSILFFMASCGPSRDKSVKTIDALESRLYSRTATGFDQAAADSLLEAYQTFFRKFSGDSLGKKYNFRAATLAMNLNKPALAIELYDRFIEKYPGDRRAEPSMFFKAYTYENQVKDLEKAKEGYLLFLEKYPSSDFADDAQMALQNLGKSPEQMIREFEERAKADSTRIADSLAALNPKKK